MDRAALDIALELGIPCGGWCPKGRGAEDGTISDRYPLEETPLANVAQRTEWNVRDSDGTLVVMEGPPAGGTALTIKLARRHRKPCLVVDLPRTKTETAESIAAWISNNKIRVLNVAGPRESKAPGIYKKAMAFLRGFIEGCVRRSKS